MHPYTAKDIADSLNNCSQHITHVFVAHTRFRPFNSNQYQINRMAEQARKDCRYALNCFAKSLYPNATNKPVRNPQLFRPLTFVTIENAKENLGREQTIHFNIALGNLPKHLLTDEIKTLFIQAWVEKAHQSDDVNVYDFTGKQAEAKTWIGYSLKEAQQQKDKAWKVEGIWDVENCWIPHAALNTD